MKFSGIAPFIAALLLASSCSGGKGSDYAGMPGDTLTSRAELLTLIDRGDFVTAEIADPWNKGKKLASYALVGRDKPIPAGLENEFAIIRVPLQRSIVYSSTNASAICELGALNSVAAVADGNYYAPTDTIARLIASGKIKDIGNSLSPKPETIIDIQPEALLTSPYENAGHGIIDELGVNVIDCADYMETDPLGRAEWILLLGELYGKRESAQSIYDRVQNEYTSLRQEAAKASSARPKVLTEMLTSGVWYVPGGNSYMSRLISDAGAINPWASEQSSGSLQLSVENVIDQASDADIWLLRNYNAGYSKSKVFGNSDLYAHIKAYKTGDVYNCDASITPLFNDIAFHPERILLDFIIIFHPEIFPDLEPKYYKKVSGQ